MRARLLPAVPRLAEEYGLMPWDIARLTPAEINGFLADLEEKARAQRQAQQRARARRRR